MDGVASLRFQRETSRVPFLPLYKRGGSGTKSLSCFRSLASARICVAALVTKHLSSLRLPLPLTARVSRYLCHFFGCSFKSHHALRPSLCQNALPKNQSKIFWPSLAVMLGLEPPRWWFPQLMARRPSSHLGKPHCPSSHSEGDLDALSLGESQSLGREYRSFDERSSNLRRPTGLTAIPGIHVPLQMDDSACRDVNSGQGDSDQDRTEFAERTAAGARASTSTSSGGPPSSSGAGGENIPPRDINTIPPLPTGLGPMPYSNFYGDGLGGFTKEFREKYSIPEDVLVERVFGDRISFGGDFIILPLFAITEGGVKFPMSPFLRYFLSDYNLAPIQVAVNTWRILCLAIKLAESNNIPFTLGDLMLMYVVSRNPKYDKYYLTTRQHFDHLGPINPLLDYPCPTRTGSAVERPYRIPRKRGFPGAGDKPDCSAPNKGLFVIGRWTNLIALLRCADQDAPTLLDYEPTYSGFAHRKNKENMKPFSSLRLNKWSILQPPFPLKSPTPAAEETCARLPGEKAKVIDGVEVLTTICAERDPANWDGPSAPFVPDFECPDGHLITIGDSLEDNPLLAMTLLKGLALPKDMDNLPTSKAKTMAELCLLLAKAGQCASKAFSDMDVLLETNRSLREDLQGQRTKMERTVEEIETLEAKSAEEENARLREEKARIEEDLPKQLEEAGDAGYNEAGEYYQQQVQSLVTNDFKEGELKGIRDTHHSSFLHGYQVGLNYAEVPKVDHRREPPVVPPLELPEVLPQEDLPNPAADSQPDLTDAANK
ncbi:hypothetical protein RHSIM_Rhsim04G0129500 [Rhododendron simsii]|uniref:Uncharacterized protein n=1 Tax=Rhododendron simsii TaxID=118357 RepID=A0A834H2D8_RHOSS|nr:hypothetical protein RHSIM_Rhsim04G0129500 [Rhododendron simsii]